MRVHSASHEAAVRHRQGLADYLNIELPPGESDQDSWTKGTDRTKVRREPSLSYIARRPPHFASRLQVAEIVKKDKCMNEAFIHAIANKDSVNVVTFSPIPYGPHWRLATFKYSPGFKEPNYHVTLADIKKLISDNSTNSTNSTRFFHLKPSDATTLGHFSYMRPLPTSSPPGAIKVDSGSSAPNSTERRRNPKREKRHLYGGGSPSRAIEI